MRDSIVAGPIGQLPSPELFKVFMKRVSGVLYVPDEESQVEWTYLVVARLCAHTIHPGNSCKAADVCPACTMRQCIASLERISHVWWLLGGPGNRPHDAVQLGLYLVMRQLWHLEKTRWANLIHRHEYFAWREQVWEDQCREVGFEVPEVVRKSKGCKDALKWAGRSPFLLDGWDVPCVPQRMAKKETDVDGLDVENALHELLHSPSHLPQTTKTESSPALPTQGEDATSDRVQEPDDQTENAVEEETSNPSTTEVPHPSPCVSPKSNTSPVYAPSPLQPPSTSTLHSKSVSFSHTLIDAPTRPSNTYNRLSPSYVRGRQASPSGSEWADTSFCSDALYAKFGVEDEADDEMSSDWDDECSDSEEDKGNVSNVLVATEMSIQELHGKRVNQPVFKFVPRKSANTATPDIDTRSDDSGNDGVREAVRDIGAVPLPLSTTIAAGSSGMGTVYSILPRRRSHDELDEEAKAGEEAETKRQCQ